MTSILLFPYLISRAESCILSYWSRNKATPGTIQFRWNFESRSKTVVYLTDKFFALFSSIVALVPRFPCEIQQNAVCNLNPIRSPCQSRAGNRLAKSSQRTEKAREMERRRTTFAWQKQQRWMLPIDSYLITKRSPRRIRAGRDKIINLNAGLAGAESCRRHGKNSGGNLRKVGEGVVPRPSSFSFS